MLVEHHVLYEIGYTVTLQDFFLASFIGVGGGDGISVCSLTNIEVLLVSL